MKRPLYVGSGTQSISFQLVSVNGTPVSGASTITHANVTLAACPCVIAGPNAQVGSDVFALSTYDGQYSNGVQSGKVISTATSGAVNIVASTTNTIPLTLNGVIASLTIAAPTATAGVALATPSPLSVVAKDVDGNIIVGTYSTPITLNESDKSGATALATAGADSPPPGTLLSSSDTAGLTYTGLAIAPATISASASGATTATAQFAPTHGITYGGPLNGTTPEIALTATNGTGSFTASEAGWTNAPYNHALNASASGCATVGATTPASGTAFTVSVASSPAAGTCTLTLTDFPGGSTVAVTIAYVHGTQTFAYTGASQTFTVPFGVSAVTIAAAGAQGGLGAGGSGGLGGSVTATIPVTATEALTLEVGGSSGFGGGGIGGGGPGGGAGNGGGASDVREGGAALSNRVVVAGGGGGAGIPLGGDGGLGANGSGQNGATGATLGTAVGGGGGGGATVSAPGVAGAGGPDSAGTSGTNGAAGALGLGGNGAGGFAGGGGGGYYGGGGGGTGGSDGLDGFAASGGGGGGSSYVEPSATSITNQGYQTGNGSITISW